MVELLIGLILGLGMGAYAFNSNIRGKVSAYLSKGKKSRAKKETKR